MTTNFFASADGALPIDKIAGAPRLEEYSSLNYSERMLVDDLVSYILEATDDIASRRFSPAKLLVKKTVKRLLEKLRNGHLDQTEVGGIVEGVWLELNKTKNGNGNHPTPIDPRDRIICDIMHKVDAVLPYFKGRWDQLVAIVGRETSSKVVRIAANRAWPHVRDALS